jgi:hypothetical protein
MTQRPIANGMVGGIYAMSLALVGVPESYYVYPGSGVEAKKADSQRAPKDSGTLDRRILQQSATNSLGATSKYLHGAPPPSGNTGGGG